MTDAVAKPSVSIFDVYETAEDAEVTGVWTDVGPSRFLLARAGGANVDFAKTTTKRLAPFQAALESMSKKQTDELAIGIFVDTILKDWENVTERDGTVIEFNRDNARRVLLQLPNLFSALMVEANKLANYTKRNVETAAKN